MKIPFLFLVLFHFARGQEGTCPVTQECISIKECPYTKELFARVKSTSDNTERAQLIQALRLRVCGKPSDRTVCCTSLAYPRKIGDISKNTYHDVAGELWALDENTLEFRKFIYDGQGPDAFFILGDQTANPEPNLVDAIPLPYFNEASVPLQKRYYVEDPEIPILSEFRGQDIQLRLPPGVRVADLQWLSLYCRNFNIDFGNVRF